MKRIGHIMLCCFLANSLLSAAQEDGLSREAYLHYCLGAAKKANGRLQSLREQWKQSIKPDRRQGYRPPDREVYLAALNANLFELTADTSCLSVVKDILLHFGSYKKMYPNDFYTCRAEYGRALPALPQPFSMRRYVYAYIILKRNLSLSAKESKIIEQNIAESADCLMRLQEWGVMNRAMICAEGLGLAAKAIPRHPHAQDWKTLSEYIARDNFNRIHMEDSQKYLLIWLHAAIRYAAYVQESDALLRTQLILPWFDYMLKLFCPADIIPDFGDADWGSNKFIAVALFEKGAALTHKACYRWAAKKIFEHWTPKQRDNIAVAMMLSDACLWADFNTAAAPPGEKSTDPLQNIWGKKLVFRNGWEANSTYLLLNYRDEEQSSEVFSAYLKSTFAVNEEKMHHGHADENSICLLMYGGAVLLHDGGYRDGIPSGAYGAYRADYFHNRTVVRPWRFPPERFGEMISKNGLLYFIHNNGMYKPVNTSLTDHLCDEEFEMSRTAVRDPNTGYVSERTIVYLKEPGCFIVIDAVKILKKGDYLLGNLWHTRIIAEKGANWYDGYYDSLNSIPAAVRNKRLLIWFPQRNHIRTAEETERRYYQQEQLIYNACVLHADSGDRQTFITALIPHDTEENPAELATQLSVVQTKGCTGIVSLRITYRERQYILAVRAHTALPEPDKQGRPQYSWESGKYQTGNITTDADFLYAWENNDRLRYSIAGGTGIAYGKVTLFRQGQRTFIYSYDNKAPQSAASKVRYRKGEYEKKRN